MGLDKKSKSSLQTLLRTMTDLHCARPFRESVDARRYPDYYLVISRPMDLKTMRKKLSEGSYASAEDFREDALLLFDNCRRYTADPANPVRKQCDELQRRFEAKWQTFVQRAAEPETDKKRKPAPSKKRKTVPNLSVSLELPKDEAASESTALIMTISRQQPQVIYEDELDMDDGKPKPAFESVIKFSLPENAPEALKVVIPPPAPAAPVVAPVPLLPSKEEYIRAVLAPLLEEHTRLEVIRQVVTAFQRYQYTLLPCEAYALT